MNILVSACLLGVECRYDGTGKEMVGLKALCPEVFGESQIELLKSRIEEDKS